ncbi:MAG: ATP-dependent Clp protease ATP-binding subunit [Candidatus Microsaccharimonas sossegonensis]|uniref:ATP-dependent Clp protease ATP-binding subunit n=1 Tax=Candidatus Microsaccharimonas sossegonensis TaxID=2506948 RepID=A0A4Q0AGG5_9BACT|nr:MAG: ATP-dependent Clp protease ATP-binding subunit [Candidatus Microsaccharimonas sossegonensis]
MGAKMDVSLFDYKSPRAMKARLGRQLSPWALTLEISVVCLIVGGITLLAFGFAIGWLAIGLAAIPGMIVEWYKYELRDVPRLTNGKRVDDLLDGEILGLFTDQPTPQNIATLLSRSISGQFFAVRFGISGGFLEQIVSSNRDDTKAVFEEALHISSEVGNRITAGVLMLALVRQIPAKETLLGHLQLSEDDIFRGIKWYHHLRNLIDSTKVAARKPGGIGRDWSFGWIPTLSHFGQNISELSVRRTDLRIDTINQITKAINGRGVVALVGLTGVGKTQVVYELASELMSDSKDVPNAIRYHQIFMLDATRLVSMASGRGELEGLIQKLLSEAYTAKNIIICLDNAQVFFEEGVGSVDMTNMLLPILEVGRLPIILTVDEQKFLQISKRTPALAAAVNRITVHPTDEVQTLAVLEEQLPTIEFKRHVTYMYQAIREAYKLSARYVYDIAMPGQALSLLDAAADYAESGLVTAQSVGKAIEKTIGVKTNIVDDENERDKLLHLESLIHQRMIGQERAVSVIADALRRARAGIRNQQRPVGTFLFLGPTGVGKTELAKSLAAVYFGGEQNIIRLDMNEFVSTNDVARLIADGTEDAGSLTAQVMKQPFSVILLDEIEKAHSSVLTTLLQLLDEGILRDAKNREVSFRDTIVIATSNAGSDRIQEYLHRGYNLEQFEDTFVDELISSNVFHPEFLNRFDEIVVFAPLNKVELLKVIDLILVDVNKNLSEQKITVTVAQDAKEYLVEAGYDPRLGARPMRRVVQRSVENTVAKLMLSKELQAGGSIEMTLDQVKEILDKKSQADDIIAK